MTLPIPQPQVRTEPSRYCPRCSGLDAKTATTTTEGTLVRLDRLCPCGHRWQELIQGGPFLQHVRR